MTTKRRQVIHSQGRSMVASVYHFLAQEYKFTMDTLEQKVDMSHLRNISRRTAEATGVGLKTISKILKEEKELATTSSTKFPEPMKKRRKRDSKIDIDHFLADVVRSTIQDFHIVHREIPTLTKIKSVLNEKIGFDCCLNTLRTLLRRLGYKWRKTEKNRKVITERHEIQLSRFKYLKQIAEYRSQGRTVVYTGECFLQSKIGTGPRVVCVHAGTKDGFIENAALVYTTNSIGDNQMTHESYTKWLTEKLLPNLPTDSVIVLDNASFHNTRRAEKLPTSTSKKEDMQQWLRNKGITFDETLYKVELYEIIKKHKTLYIKYKIDVLIQQKGYDVIRLPPLHPELNAIENIWGILKNHVNCEESNAQNKGNFENLVNEGLEQINTETWRNTCNHVEKIESDYTKYVDMDFDFLFNLQDDSDESNSEIGDSSDDDDSE